mgnify:CR=1 FL=1
MSNFPNSPSDGDIHSGFVWDATLEVWNVLSTSNVLEFAVTASGSSAYVFNGAGTTADNNPTLYLLRGKTYEFKVSASGHPFYLKTTAGTGTSNAYTDGVTGNGTDSGTITLVVQQDAPDTIYYSCSNHAAMTGTINILSSSSGGGGSSSVTSSETAPSSPSTGDLWHDPAVVRTYVYHTDANSSQWVQSNPTGQASSGISAGKSIALAMIFGG